MTDTAGHPYPLSGDSFSDKGVNQMKRTMTKRFYVASNLMSNGVAEKNGWLQLLSDAIETAKHRLQVQPDTEEVYVVEVIRAVRRERTPIVVEEVRR